MKRILVVCANEASVRDKKAAKILGSFEEFEDVDYELYFIGPNLDVSPRSCSGTIEACKAFFGRKKFDVIINEYCPIANKEFGAQILRDIQTLLMKRTKREAYFITPLIPTNSASEEFDEKYASIPFNGSKVSWLEILGDLDFMLYDYSDRDLMAIFMKV